MRRLVYELGNYLPVGVEMDNEEQNELLVIEDAEEVALVPQAMADHEARLNVTWGGQNGDFPDPIPYDSTDDEIKQWATEALREGIPGIDGTEADLGDFKVDRFPKTDDVPYNRVFIRPKTPFGADITTRHSNSKYREGAKDRFRNLDVVVQDTAAVTRCSNGAYVTVEAWVQDDWLDGEHKDLGRKAAIVPELGA